MKIQQTERTLLVTATIQVDDAEAKMIEAALRRYEIDCREIEGMDTKINALADKFREIADAGTL